MLDNDAVLVTRIDEASVAAADTTDVIAVESAFAVPLVDQATGAVLDRDLVGTLDLVERGADGGLVVVDLKTAARKYSEDQASYCSSFRACGAHSG